MEANLLTDGLDFISTRELPQRKVYVQTSKVKQSLFAGVLMLS